jgi:hypothetical protein
MLSDFAAATVDVKPVGVVMLQHELLQGEECVGPTLASYRCRRIVSVAALFLCDHWLMHTLALMLLGQLL